MIDISKSKHTNPSPMTRRQALKEFVNDALSNSEAVKEMRHWGVKFQGSPLQVLAVAMILITLNNCLAIMIGSYLLILV